MRIISGKYKGRRILENKKFNARPTTDFAKESLFNILNNYFFFDQIKVLDLFAGTGSIGFEFASRGCSSIDMIEIDFKNFKLISEAIKILDLNVIRLKKGDAFRFIDTCKSGYDVIFADPPYDMKGIENIPEKIFLRNLLTENGWLILEHSKFYHFKNNKYFREERVYGNIHFSIFSK